MMIIIFIAVCFFQVAIVASVNGGKIANNTATIPAKKAGEEIVVCNQYIGQGVQTHEAIKKLDEKVDRLITLLQNNKSENQGFTASTCKQLYDKNLSSGNKAYPLAMDTGKVPVYCHMTSTGLGTCGGGGWTLVMKIDGKKHTFHYNSQFWTNKVNHNLPGGKTGFDTQETKLPTYWNTPFSKICLGMKIGNQMNSIVINQHANSLYSLIADGKYRATTLGRNTWKTLIGAQASSMQPNCNKEGFNTISSITAASKARIGILGNNENDCASSDSRIGFGTGGYQDDTNTCGYVNPSAADKGVKHIKAMGYILVQ